MSWHDEYDDEIEDRQKGRTELDNYFAKRSAELAELEQQLKERESQTLKFYEESQAKQAADEARWRAFQLEVTPEMRGADILRLAKKHGL